MQLEVPETTSTVQVQTTPLVSIIVVNYNGMTHLEECLGALCIQKYPAYEVLVVDNHSADGSPAYIRSAFPSVKLITSQENLGYSGAVNLALRHAMSQYIAVLNMDAIVTANWLDPLVCYLEAHPHVGAVTPKILLYDQPGSINAMGQNIHITALGFNHRLHHLDRPEETGPLRVSGLHGAAFLIRRDVLERMGGMNTACFLYHEDVDLSWLINLMGYDIYCIPTSIVRHKYVLKMDPQKLYFLERNRVAMLLTNLRWRTLLLVAPLLVLTEGMMSVYCMRRGPNYMQAKIRSLRWVWQQRRHIRQRRAHVRRLRQRSDRQMLAIMRLNYEWDQLLSLGR